MMPVVICKRQFRHLLRGARAIYLIDNEGVQEAFVSGSTKSKASRVMLVEAMFQDAQNDSLTWYTRVPSPSNIADAPSRLKWEELAEMIDCDIVQVELDYKLRGKYTGSLN